MFPQCGEDLEWPGQPGLGRATASTIWVWGPGAPWGTVELVTKDALRGNSISDLDRLLHFPLTLLRENLALPFFSSPAFPTFFSSSEDDRPHFSGPESPEWFPWALACHMSPCLPTHLAICAAVSGLEAGFRAPRSYHPQYRCCQDPCPADGFLLRFLPYKHAGETWQSPAFVPAAFIICSVSVESLTCHWASLQGSGHWGPMPSSQRAMLPGVCFYLSFNIWTVPQPRLGSPYCVFLTGAW